MTGDLLIQLAGVIVLGAAAQWLAWRLRVPSILLLLVLGFLSGPVAGLIDPDALFGDLLLPFVSISVALILYEGGLSLSFAELPKVAGVVRNLVSLGALVTWLVAALAVHFIFRLAAPLAILTGAVLVVTGPTVILPLLRHIRPTGRVGPILKWEGIVIDPIGAILAVLVFEVIIVSNPNHAVAVLVFGVIKTLLIGGGLGLLAAGVLALLLYKYWVPDYLQNAVSLMLVVVAHTTSNALQHESGLLAVTVMGMTLANQRRVDVKHIVEFKENLRVLLISFLFILLAGRMKLEHLHGMVLPGLLLVGVLVVIARPLAVLVSTVRSKLSVRERLFLCWMAPRGIVAAAVASVFALRLEMAGVTRGYMLLPIVFTAIIGTVVVYGLTAPLVAWRLRVADPHPEGILFAGAPEWARELAAMLKARGYSVALVDNTWQNIAAAKLGGLPAYHESILAEHALREIELGGLGRLFAVTSNDWVNTLAVQRFIPVFGREHCYQLPPQKEAPGKKTLHKHLQGRWLFDPEATDESMRRRFAAGAKIKATTVTESFTYGEFRRLYGDLAVPLLILNERSRITVLTADRSTEPLADQTIISLVREPDELKEAKEEKQKKVKEEKSQRSGKYEAQSE